MTTLGNVPTSCLHYTQAAGATDFLIKKGSLLGPLFAMLIDRVGETQGHALVRKLASWALSSTFPSVESEVVVLTTEAATVGEGG